MNYQVMAAEQESYAIEMRRYFHRHPEVSGKEEKTVERICQELKQYDIPYVNVPNGGVFAFLGEESRGRTVLLRADIDALPGKESPINAGGFPKVVVSEDDTAAHVCGHDAHIAMLLGAARALKKVENNIPGRVILMFERGEEGGGNIAWLLKYAFEQHWSVDSSFGMHIFPDIPAGKASVVDGPAMAGSLSFSVKIFGKTCHGAQPNNGTSPIECFSSIYDTLKSMRMLYANPYDPMVFSLGQVHAGTANNIIPGELTFGGTFRVNNTDDAERIKAQLIKTFDHTAIIYNCQVEYSISGPSMALRNDHICAVFASRTLSDAFGSGVMEEGHSRMGGESFGITSAIWPGVFLFMGCGNQETGMTAKNHSDCFEPDESVFKLGMTAHIAYAMEFLKDGPETESRAFRGDLKEFFQKYSPASLVAFED